MPSLTRVSPQQQELLIRFPWRVFKAYKCFVEWNDDVVSFEDKRLLAALRRSPAYRDSHQPSILAAKDVHGPFALSKIEVDHYTPIPFEVAASEIQSQLATTQAAALTHCWNPVDAGTNLSSFLSSIEEGASHCYKLTLSIHLDEDVPSEKLDHYFADWYKEVPILDHFEEWLVYNHSSGVLWMLYLLYD